MILYEEIFREFQRNKVKYVLVGGIAFILAGLLYISIMVMNALKNRFEWYMLSWAIQIAGIAFFIGILFLINWFKKKK